MKIYTCLIFLVLAANIACYGMEEAIMPTKQDTITITLQNNFARVTCSARGVTIRTKSGSFQLGNGSQKDIALKVGETFTILRQRLSVAGYFGTDTYEVTCTTEQPLLEPINLQVKLSELMHITEPNQEATITRDAISFRILHTFDKS